MKQEQIICNSCLYQLPYTNFHQLPNNPIEKIFWGRAIVEQAGAYLYFNKGNKVQNLMHRFKYKGVKDIGKYIGAAYGRELYKANYLSNADVLIPVPLYPEKQRKRGYNQSQCFAEGLSEGLGIKTESETLIRVKNSATQTQKNRFERWQNVEHIFEIANQAAIQNKHIILVDDVITTGATVEACIATLKKTTPCKISFLALAYATQS